MNIPDADARDAAARNAIAQVAAEALRVDPRRRGTARLADAIKDASTADTDTDVVVVKPKEPEVA